MWIYVDEVLTKYQPVMSQTSMRCLCLLCQIRGPPLRPNWHELAFSRFAPQSSSKLRYVSPLTSCFLAVPHTVPRVKTR